MERGCSMQHSPVSLAESTQFLVLKPIYSRSILILPYHMFLGLSKDLFSVGLPVKILKNLQSFSIWHLLMLCNAIKIYYKIYKTHYLFVFLIDLLLFIC